MPPKTKTIGAIHESLQGPGVITHEGGDNILIADVKGGLPGVEHALVFEGEEVIVDGDDEFRKSLAERRQVKIGDAAVIRSLGQASYSFEEASAPAIPDEVPASPAAVKLAEELGIDLADVEYDGEKITVPDVKGYVLQDEEAPVAA